jgi:molybdopterin-containing oxidoreductase family membrane subunit
MKVSLRSLNIQGTGYMVWLGVLMLLVVLGLGAVWRMEHYGHVVTGMTNQVVWGLPHVFAVFLVVAASGALNVASMASVFGKTEFKPLAPLSGLLALALLIGGLSVLMLDLGRPERLIVAMTHFNFKSIFTWNIFLYTGFMALVALYLWTLMERRMNSFTPAAGMVAFIWRMALTTGTGSIFGFLVARQAYDSALLAPLFIALSLSYGFAVFGLTLTWISRVSAQALQDVLIAKLARLQVIFIAATLYFLLVYHLTNLYFAKHQAFELFLLVEGGIYTGMFWLGQVLFGGIAPMVLLMHPRIGQLRARFALSAGLVVLGGFFQMYVTIIGGQAFPIVLFPGREVSSSFYDGVVHSYAPTWPEWMLGFAGLAITALIVTLALRVLCFLPARFDQIGVQVEDSVALRA